MATTIGIKIFVAYVFLATTFFQEINSCVGKIYQIKIANAIPGTPSLTSHCKKKNGKDLGTVTVAQITYKFKICQKFIRHTEVNCEFQWGGKNRIVKVFDSKFASKECHDDVCVWHVLDDGFYLVSPSSDGDVSVKKFDWQGRNYRLLQ